SAARPVFRPSNGRPDGSDGRIGQVVAQGVGVQSAIPSLRRRGVDPIAARHRASRRASRGGWGLLLLTGLGTLTLGLALVTIFGISLAVIGLRSVDGVGGLVDMFSRDLPAPEATFDQETFKSTFILDRNGEKLYEVFDPN